MPQSLAKLVVAHTGTNVQTGYSCSFRGSALSGNRLVNMPSDFQFLRGILVDAYRQICVRTPLRWQDVVFIAGVWSILLMLFYVSYRLLKFAFRRERSA
jgi:hypothetical protein